MSHWKPGDWIIYRKQKISKSPGPRAIEVRPSPGGETYQYMVDKFWIVDAVLETGQLRLKTRRGKTHTVAADDPGIRRAGWWSRWWHRERFQAIQSHEQQSVDDVTTS